MALEQSWKKACSRAATKSIPLLQPEHGFCLKNGSKSGQTQGWYPNDKMLLAPVSFNGRCCSTGYLGIVLC